jgi:hypothetical protein
MIKPTQAALELYRNPDTGRRFSFSGYEFTRDIMDDFAPRVVCQKPNQVGFTVLATLRTMYALDVLRTNTFYLMPTTSGVRDYVVARLKTLIAASPRLTDYFPIDGIEHKKTIHEANGYWRGSNSRSRLMSVPVGFLVIDEFDECHTAYDISSRAGNWSAVDLARKRLTGQVRHHEMDISTPTAPGVGISAEFEASDQRLWIVPCEHCSWKGPLSWEMVKWHDCDPQSAAIECPKCKISWGREDPASLPSIRNGQRCRAVSQGQWVPLYPDRDVHGYCANQLLSPTIRLVDLVTEWLEAIGNESKIWVFQNARLGLPYMPATSKLTPDIIKQCFLPNSRCMEAFPGPAAMGIDTGAVHHWVVGARDVGNQIGLFARGIITDLDQADDLIRRYGVTKCMVDAGGEPEAARKLCERWPGIVHRVSYSEAIAGVHIHEIPEKSLAVVNRTETLDALFQRIRLGWQSPQGIMLAENIGEEFIKHLCATQRVLMQDKRTGRTIARYMRAGPDHYAHAANYMLVGIALTGGPRIFEVSGEIV